MFDPEVVTELDPRDARRLGELCFGEVLARGDRDYADACVGYNLHVNWSPEVVVRAAGPADVSRAVMFARDQGLSVAVRSGGTGSIGAPVGSLLIDLGRLASVGVQPESVRVGAGANWGEIDRETAQFDRFAPGAEVSWVGAGGYTLGGGNSWMARKNGFASDNLLELEMIDAGGQPICIDPHRQPDLFWGMAGSGWNFGVVTSLTLRTHRVSRVLAGTVVWSGNHLSEALAFWEAWTNSTPDEVNAALAVTVSPPDAPPEAGPVVVRISFCALEQTPAALDCIAKLRAFSTPMMDSTVEKDYLDVQDEPTRAMQPGMHQRFRMIYLDAITEDVIASIVAAVEDLPPLTMVGIHHYGGALARIDENSSAMSHRDAKFNFVINVCWRATEDAEASLAWQDASLAAVRDHRPDRAFVNNLFDEPDRIASAYNPTTLARLKKLKRQWDPDNLFRNNYNVASDERAMR